VCVGGGSLQQHEAQGKKSDFQIMNDPSAPRPPENPPALGGGGGGLTAEHRRGTSCPASRPPSAQVGDVGEEALSPPLLQVDGHEVCKDGDLRTHLYSPK